MIRAFVAVDLPSGVLETLRGTMEKLKSLGLDGKPTRLESIHLTLKFLGNIDEPRADAIAQTLREEASRHAPFDLSVRSVGVFPNLARPRVVWFGVARSDPLTRLHSAVEAALEPLGFEPERRYFKPHLTLMRLKSTRNLPKLVEYLKQEGLRAESGSFQVEELHLYRSILKPAGAEYSKLASVQLGV